MSPRGSGPKKTKFTLWLLDDRIEDLTKIQKASGKESLAEVVREALLVYTEVLKARREGVELYYQDTDGESGPIWILRRLVPALLAGTS